jgi:hypothetical protein
MLYSKIKNNKEFFYRYLFLSFCFYSFITLIFVILKLNGIINWSWLWVTSPMWIPFFATVGVGIFIGITTLFIYLILEIIKRLKDDN